MGETGRGPRARTESLATVHSVPPDTRPEWMQQLDEWHLLTATRIVLIILVALIATWMVRRLIKRFVDGMTALKMQMRVDHVRAEQRSHTMTAVLRSTAAGAIWTVAAIAILSEAGVNVGALVAGASIIGAALAFGSQQVLRDLLAGFFMFSEDQYGVGDLVDLGEVTGTVEWVSLRVTRLRDVEGRVWYVPHGQITRVANLSQEWAQAVLDVPVSRDADLREVTATIEEIAAGLRDDDAVAADILDDPQVLGVQDLLDDRVVLRLVVKTRPAAQFAVMRALRTRVLAASAEGRLPVPAAPVSP
jgi:small-conductance mechanosensitive channel